MTYRLAILSDVHGDLQALEDALRQIEALRCDGVVCAGDLVDYGLFPEETIALLMEKRIPCLRGNHDRWAANDGGRTWDLSRRTASFLKSLPTQWRAIIEGVRVAVHHASPRGDMDGIDPEMLDLALAETFLREADCDVLLVGHTHRAFCVEVEGNRLIANPAALLRDPTPGSDNPPATGSFGVLQLPSREFRVYRASDGSSVDIERRELV